MIRENPHGWPPVFSYLLLGLWLIMCTPTSVLADGGAIRQTIHQGKLRVTVFTSPTPPRAGLIDVTVLVQDATTGEPQPDSRVQVHAAPRGKPDRFMTQEATRDTATNKLLFAAIFDLSNSGTWDFQVFVEHLGERVEVLFDLEVSNPLPAWYALAGWIAWPLLVVALYVLHRLLVRSKRAGPHLAESVDQQDQRPG